jgi:hypothetical protein
VPDGFVLIRLVNSTPGVENASLGFLGIIAIIIFYTGGFEGAVTAQTVKGLFPT